MKKNYLIAGSILLLLTTLYGYDYTKHADTTGGHGVLVAYPEVGLTDKDLVSNLMELQKQRSGQGAIGFWQLPLSQRDAIHKCLNMPGNLSDDKSSNDLLSVKFDELRGYDTTENVGTVNIDYRIVHAILQNELERQAAETSRSQIQLYLQDVKDKIESSNKKYIDFVDLDVQERRAIQYALNVSQSGSLDQNTADRIDAIRMKASITEEVYGHPYAINIPLMNVIIGK